MATASKPKPKPPRLTKPAVLKPAAPVFVPDPVRAPLHLDDIARQLEGMAGTLRALQELFGNVVERVLRLEEMRKHMEASFGLADRRANALGDVVTLREHLAVQMAHNRRLIAEKAVLLAGNRELGTQLEEARSGRAGS